VATRSVEYSQKDGETLCGAWRDVKMQRVAHRSHGNATCASGESGSRTPAYPIWREVTRSRILNASKPPVTMLDPKQKSIVIRDLESFEDLQQAEAVEREVWALADRDVLPMTMAVATKAAGSIWIGAFDGDQMAGFAFGFLGMEQGHLMLHSHMLAVREPYRDLNVGHKLKLAQRDRALAMRVQEITWTFDPLQSKNAHLNFGKLGVISSSYKVDFYGPETSSVLHRNSTDRLWVTWPMTSRRVRDRLEGKHNRPELLDLVSNLLPLIQFNGDGKPVRTDLAAALSRHRIAIEIPSDILSVERKDPGLAREWRLETRWAFTEALKAGFFVAEFCRTVRGKQGPGVYLLEKGSVEEYVPEMARSAPPSAR
jgi:predicted GNAT superfamily acetyltransferase